jgi:hypothetical protein
MGTKALISTSYINGYAIFQALKKLGIHAFALDANSGLPMPAKPHLSEADYLFFTEESSLRLALTGKLDGYYLPQHFPLHLLDDKWAFVEWLNEYESLPNGLKQWTLDQCSCVTYPCLLKAKHSWVNSVKIPRGWICYTRYDLDKSLFNLYSSEYSPTDFFIQEWLGDFNCRVISVCGFFDSQNHHRDLVAVVERIASHTKGLSCSSAIQTVNDQWNLVADTSLILDQINFTGPYEIEYLILGDNKFVLELNPRFWMQNSIFLDFGNGLVKRYLGLDADKDHAFDRLNNVVWIDGIHLIYSLLCFRVAYLLPVIYMLIKRSPHVTIFPSLPLSVLFVCKKVIGKLLKVFLSSCVVAPIGSR